MRRGLAIFLVLFFSLGPLTSALPGSEDARLPPCCRRHGAHHCSMAMRMATLKAGTDSGNPTFTAPLTCPYFPGDALTTLSAVDALAPYPVSLPVLLAQPLSLSDTRPAPRQTQIRTRAGRGPPASALA